LGHIVDVCARYQDQGRQVLLTNLTDWLEPNDPNVGRAITTIEQLWPTGQAMAPIYTAPPQGSRSRLLQPREHQPTGSGEPMWNWLRTAW